MMTYRSSSDVQLGDEAFLICNYDGSPPPEAQWLHNGTILWDGADGVNIIGGAYGDSLTVIHIAHASHNNGGTYSCIVTNSAKSFKADFVLYILGEINNDYHTCVCAYISIGRKSVLNNDNVEVCCMQFEYDMVVPERLF